VTDSTDNLLDPVGATGRLGRVTTAVEETSSEFDRSIALGPDPTGSRGAWTAELGAGWRIADAVNGGLLLALAGNALRHELGTERGHGDPLSISAYYLSAAVPGPATVSTQILRSGRQMSTGQVSISQQTERGPVERLRALATFGELPPADGAPVRSTAPDMPSPDACVRAAEAPAGLLKHADFLDRVDVRLDPATAGWAVGRPSRRGEIRGWLRMPDRRAPDPLLLLLAVDALPPVGFDLGLAGWMPTLELTTYVRARPAPGWLRLALSSRHHEGGFLEEDAEVWDSTGRLVAQSRQLVRTVVPRR
jgi:acyl-CoA thioesterase